MAKTNPILKMLFSSGWGTLIVALLGVGVGAFIMRGFTNEKLTTEILYEYRDTCLTQQPIMIDSFAIYTAWKQGHPKKFTYKPKKRDTVLVRDTVYSVDSTFVVEAEMKDTSVFYASYSEGFVTTVDTVTVVGELIGWDRSVRVDTGMVRKTLMLTNTITKEVPVFRDQLIKQNIVSFGPRASLIEETFYGGIGGSWKFKNNWSLGTSVYTDLDRWVPTIELDIPIFKYPKLDSHVERTSEESRSGQK
jgi:hypothetical protein